MPGNALARHAPRHPSGHPPGREAGPQAQHERPHRRLCRDRPLHGAASPVAGRLSDGGGRDRPAALRRCPVGSDAPRSDALCGDALRNDAPRRNGAPLA